MSSQQSVNIEVMSDFLAVTYTDVAALALLAYDTLLILPSEIAYIWHRRVRLGTVLYLLARYPALLACIITVYLNIANIHSNCLSIVVLPGVQGLLLARVYATSQHNQGMGWVLWAFSLLLYIGSLGTAVFITVKNVCIVTAQDQDAIILVDTINTVFLMLFDTLVVVVTIYNTLGLMRHSREFQKFPGKSLSQTLAEQGLIRYGFVLSITLAGGITRKVLRASIAGILTLVQDSLSVIIICRCHLVLRERVAHPNGTTHSAHHPLTSFRAATRQIHNSFMQEFGNLSIEKFGTSEAIEPHREDDPSSTAVAGIELEEIPRGRELANAVNESASEALDKPQHAAASTGEELIGV